MKCMIFVFPGPKTKTVICVRRLNIFPMSLKNIVVHERRFYWGRGRRQFPLGLKADTEWCEHIVKRQWQHFDLSDL